MRLSKMTRQEIKPLLRVLAEFEREEMELLIWERREGRLHQNQTPVYGRGLVIHR